MSLYQPSIGCWVNPPWGSRIGRNKLAVRPTGGVSEIMKKVLLGTSALVAVSVIAAGSAEAAEKIKLSVGGYSEHTVGVADTDEDQGGTDRGGFGIFEDQEISFKGSTTLDNGLKVAFEAQLEASSGDTSGDNFDEVFVTVTSADLGQILVGSENLPNYKMGIEYPTVSRSGLSSGDYTFWLGNPTGSDIPDSPIASTIGRYGANDPLQVSYYSPRLAGVQIGVGYAPSADVEGAAGADLDSFDGGQEDTISAAINYKNEFDGIGVHGSFGFLYTESLGAVSGSGVSDTDDDEFMGYNGGLQVSYGGFTVGGGFAFTNDDFTPTTVTQSPDGYSFNIGGQYKTGPYGVSVGYMYGEVEGDRSVSGDDERWGIEAAGTYNLGPGVNLHASVAYVEWEGESPGEADDAEGVVGIAGIVLSF